MNNSSLNSYSLLAQAASSVRRVGPASIGGVTTTHYSIVVDFTRLPSTYPNRAALQASGLTKVPVELYLDSHGRPVEVTEKFAVSGHSVAVKLVASRYNQPVHIAAPPKSQIDTAK